MVSSWANVSQPYFIALPVLQGIGDSVTQMSLVHWTDSVQLFILNLARSTCNLECLKVIIVLMENKCHICCGDVVKTIRVKTIRVEAMLGTSRVYAAAELESMISNWFGPNSQIERTFNLN